MKITSTILIGICVLLLASCRQQGDASSALAEEEESMEAKAMLQGIWIENETQEVAFRAEGDTIYYPDSASQPAYFRIVGDSLCLGANRYPIAKQGQYVFWFRNQAGDLRKFIKSETDDDTIAFTHRQPEILTATEVIKIDSVVFFGGDRYHWYIAVNPTKYKVVKTNYSNEGVRVENVYYDNIIHVSLYKGAACLFSRDLTKQMYAADVPQEFLEQAILGNMHYDRIDARGVHFNATLCIPDGASCYMVETLIGFDGKMTMKLLEN